MNLKIIKIALLFVGVLVKSHPTLKKDIIPGFEGTNVKSIMFEDGDFPDVGADLNTQIQVSLGAWKPGVSLPKGTWYVYLVAKDHYYETDVILKIAELEYNGTEHNWVRIQDLKWIDIPSKHLSQVTIMLKPSNISTSDRKAFRHSSVQNWIYNIFFKIRNTSAEGIREDENDFKNPTVEFCSRDITTVGPNKTLAARCRFDPLKQKHMDSCLNWRRADEVGYSCFSIMNSKKNVSEKAIETFCAKDHWLEDCRCINRRYYQEYQEERSTTKLPDYCWYAPCKSTTYLTKEKGQKVRCINTRCEIIFIDRKKYLECTKKSIGRQEWPSEQMATPDY